MTNRRVAPGCMHSLLYIDSLLPAREYVFMSIWITMDSYQWAKIGAKTDMLLAFEKFCSVMGT